MSAAATTSAALGTQGCGERAAESFRVEESARAVSLSAAVQRRHSAGVVGVGADGNYGQRRAAGDRHHYRRAGGQPTAIFEWRFGVGALAGSWLSRACSLLRSLQPTHPGDLLPAVGRIHRAKGGFVIFHALDFDRRVARY